MLPRFGTSKLCDNAIVVLIGLSIIAWLDNGFLYHALALAPDHVVRGQLWRLVTWPLIEGSPIQLIFTCAAIYKLGGELSIRWGERRLRRFTLEIVFAAGVISCVLALVTGHSELTRTGGWALSDALVIAWARQFPNARLTVYWLLTLHGRKLINVTIGANILFALAWGPVHMAPELCACVVTALYPQALLRR